jgi:hypothetical protein
LKDNLFPIVVDILLIKTVDFFFIETTFYRIFSRSIREMEKSGGNSSKKRVEEAADTVKLGYEALSVTEERFNRENPLITQQKLEIGSENEAKQKIPERRVREEVLNYIELVENLQDSASPV